MELEKKRRQYCEYFLPPELQSLQEISVVVKRRMIEMYVKVRYFSKLSTLHVVVDLDQLILRYANAAAAESAALYGRVAGVSGQTENMA